MLDAERCTTKPVGHQPCLTPCNDLFDISTPAATGGLALDAPSIGIHITQRSNWYSKSSSRLIINDRKQMHTDWFQITPAHELRA